MLRDYLSISLKSLVHRRLRSWLTMLGIFIGIAAIVSLISLGNGLRDAILSQLNFIGSDQVIISPGGLAGPPGSESGSSRLSEDDLRTIQRIPDVRLASGFLARTLRVGHGEEESLSLVWGMPTDRDGAIFDELSAFDVAFGRKIRDGDSSSAVIGYGLYDGSVFEEPIALGKRITISGREFEVVGISARVGNPIFDDKVIISLDSLKELADVDDELSGIRARPETGVTTEELAEQISRRLRRSRGVDEGEEDFQVETSQQLLDSIGTVLLVVQAVVIGIAAISLLVGGVGILNTMYTSVLERTKHIGIMKAIGARNQDIFLLFFIESGLLGAAGGLVGILLGAGLGKLVQLGGKIALGSDLIKSDLSLNLILGALAFSFVIGSVAGVLPAIQASRSNPVESLRYE